MRLAQQLHFVSYAALANVTRTQLCGLGLYHGDVQLEDRETNFRSFIYSHISTNPANLVMIDVSEIVKKTAAEHIVHLQLTARWVKKTCRTPYVAYLTFQVE